MPQDPKDKWNKYATPDKKWDKYAAEPKSLSAGEVVGGAVTNFFPSLYKNTLEPIVSDPVGFVKGVGTAIAGMPNPFELSNPAKAALSPTVQAIGKSYAERYGGVENIKNTIANDPAGILLDVSTVLGGAGALAKTGGLAKTGQVLGTAAKLTDPISLPINTVKSVGKVIPRGAATRLYDSAIKPSTVLSVEERANLVATGLGEGILPTHGGIKKIRSTIDDINGQISEKLVGAAKRGDVVNSKSIVSRLEELKKFYGMSVDPEPYISAIEELQKRFNKAHGKTIPIQEAQEIKKNTYRIINKSYGELSTVAKEGQKALARGIKEEIAAQYPEINTLNAREGSLIELEDTIQRAVARMDNKELISTSSLFTGVAAASVTQDLGIGIKTFLTKSLLENPAVKAKLAIVLNKAKKARFSGGTLPPFAVAARDATRQ